MRSSSVRRVPMEGAYYTPPTFWKEILAHAIVFLSRSVFRRIRLSLLCGRYRSIQFASSLVLWLASVSALQMVCLWTCFFETIRARTGPIVQWAAAVLKDGEATDPSRIREDLAVRCPAAGRPINLPTSIRKTAFARSIGHLDRSPGAVAIPRESHVMSSRDS